MNAPLRSLHLSLAEFVGAVLLAALLALAPAVSHAQTNEQAVMQRAIEALNNNRPGEAIAQLNTIITATSTNTRALVLRAQAYEQRRQWADAIQDYRRIQQIDPSNRLAAEGITRVNASFTQRADTQIDRMAARVASEPDNPQYRLLYADALYEADRFDEATVQYAAYVDRTQPTPDVVSRYLVALSNTGGNDQGRAIALEYTRIYPNNADLWMRLGYFYLWAGNFDDAAQAFQTALRYNAGLATAQDGLAQATDPSRRATTVYPIDRLMAEVRANPRLDDKRLQLIDLLIENGRYAEAKQQLQQITERYRGTELWRTRYDMVNQRLASNAPSGPSNFVVDRLLREVRRNPAALNTRYELVEALLRYKRYWEAYEQLQAVAEEQDRTDRWLDLFVKVDDGLIAARGTSPIYNIDRLNYRLRVVPSDMAQRYELATELMKVGRFAEANDILVQGSQYVSANDPAYVRLMAQLEAGREQFSREQVARLEAQVQRDPNNAVALRQLIEHYLVLGMEARALELYEPLLQRRSSDDEIRFRYGQTLYYTGRYDDALEQANILLGADPNNPDFQRLYAVSAIYANDFDPQAEQYLNRLLERNPRDAQLLLDVAVVRMSQGNIGEAEDLLQRAAQYTQFADAARVEHLRSQIAFEQNKLQALVILEEARALFTAKNYVASAAKYDDYFRTLGATPRGQLQELAQVHVAANDYVSALSVFNHIMEIEPAYEVQREIAKAYYNLKSYDEARDLLVTLRTEHPADWEMLYLLGDVYREQGNRNDAELAYDAALAVATTGEQRTFVSDRIAYLERGGAYDFAALLVPNAELVVGRSAGTGNASEYIREMAGVQAQVTLPGNLVAYAGLNSHGIQGTPLIGQPTTISYRINQLFGGATYDITEPIITEGLYQDSYTNRISGEAGVYDYAGYERTAPYWNVRFYHQPVDQSYQASAGVQQTEGSIALWAVGGPDPDYDVRLTQFDVQAETDELLDGMVKARGSLAYNQVTTRLDDNAGLNLYAEAGYRIFENTHLGLAYNNISWSNASTSSLFFTPLDYQTYEAWGEYEKATDMWYGRARAATGVVANSGGFQTFRLEGELIYKLTRAIGIGANAYFSQSNREVQDPTLPSTFDRYNIFVVRGALYIAL